MGSNSRSCDPSKFSALLAVYACSFSSAEAFECSLYFLCLDVGIEPFRIMHCVYLLVIFNDVLNLLKLVVGGLKA